MQSSATRSSAGGTGLGLSICRQIVRLHSGVVYAQNNTRGGATFVMILPTHSCYRECSWLGLWASPRAGRCK
jgi:signal transduction histidine kinase